MKIFAPQKKASLSLSINAIVIIVLAMTLLGLGLGFIRSQFEQISGTTTSVQEQIRQQILDDLRTGNKKLSFPTSELKLESRKSEVVSIGIKNTEDKMLNFQLALYDLSENCKDTSVNPPQPKKLTPTTDTPNANCGAFFWDNNLQTLGVGDANVFGVKFFAPQTKGTYLYRIDVADFGLDCKENTPGCTPFTGAPDSNACNNPSINYCDDKIYVQKTFFATII